MSARLELFHLAAAHRFALVDKADNGFVVQTADYKEGDEDDKLAKREQMFAYARGYCDGIDAARRILSGSHFSGLVKEV